MKYNVFFFIIVIINFLLCRLELPMSSQILFGSLLLGVFISSFFRAYRSFFNVAMVFIIIIHFLFFYGLKFTTSSSAALVFNLSLLKFNENISIDDFFHSVILCLLSGVCLLVLNPDIVFLLWVLITFLFILLLYIKKLSNRLVFSVRYFTFILPVFLFSFLLFLVFPRFTQGFYGTNVSQLIRDYGIKKINFSELSEVSQSSQSIFKVYGLPPEKINLSMLYWRESVYTTFKDLHLFESNSVLNNKNNENEKIFTGKFYTVKPSLPFKRFLPHLENYSLIDSEKHFVSRTIESTLKLKYSQSLIGSFSLSLYKDDQSYMNNINKYLTVGETNLSAILEKYPRLRSTPVGKEETLKFISHFFSERKFVYSKNPPQYKSLEDFLINGNSGYCVHFAISYAWLLRSFGIPSRVVSGYQGGEINPFNNSINVRELDGHMWVEYFLDNKWSRVDPTELVAPGRSSKDMNEFLVGLDSKNEFLQLSKITGIDFHRAFLYFDFLLSEVDLSISTIDQAFQRKLFNALLTFKNFAILLSVFSFVFLAVFFRKFFSVPSEVRQYRALILEAQQLGIEKLDTETANEFLARLKNSNYHKLERAQQIVDRYNNYCYGSRY